LKTIERAMPDIATTLRQTIRDIPDFPKPGIIFKDITPVLQDGKLFAAIIDTFADACKGVKVTRVVGVEARGFIFASALAYRLGVGLIPARKQGKLPYKTIAESYKLEYGEATLEIHDDALQKGDNIVLVDDLLATGGTAAATARMMQRKGAKIHKILFVVELSFLNGRQTLKEWENVSLVTF
jgi:adenine phosphoribosyltransferase